MRLPRPTKPIHPIPHPSLRSLNKKEKKINHYHKEYIQELKVYEKDIGEWNRIDAELSKKERAILEKWYDSLEDAKRKSHLDNFYLTISIPVEWQDLFHKYKKYFLNTKYFYIEKLDVILPSNYHR